MKKITLGIIAALVINSGLALADTVQQIQSPIYKDEIGRSHFLGKGGYSVTRQLSSQEENVVKKVAEKDTINEEQMNKIEQKFNEQKETNILDVIKEKEASVINNNTKATFSSEKRKMDASAPFGQGATNIPYSGVNDSKTMYTDEIGRLHFFGKGNIVKE